MRGFWADELDQRRQGGLYRFRKAVSPHPSDPARVLWRGRPLVNFASNDYLGLARDPRLAAAAARAQRREGTGAGASPLVSGWLPVHRSLERHLAEHAGTDASLVFPSGFAANLAAVTALAGPGDLVLSDALNHASLVDGCRLSRARVEVFAHADPSSADGILSRCRGSFRRAWIITDSVFSMDGDEAPLADLAVVARRHDAGLIVDEAHATGVLGPRGRGLSASLPMDAVPAGLVRVGTLSKALGAQGGFVAADRGTIRWIVNQGRSYMFSTALAPGSAAAARAALRLSHAEPWRRERVLALAGRGRDFMAGLGRPAPGDSAIVPVIAGPERLAMAWAGHCLDRGWLVPAIRHPSVPRGGARLRVSLSADHSDDDLAGLMEALATLPETEA